MFAHDAKEEYQPTTQYKIEANFVPAPPPTRESSGEKFPGGLPSLGMDPASLWGGRPPVFGLVAQRVGAAPNA